MANIVLYEEVPKPEIRPDSFPFPFPCPNSEPDSKAGRKIIGQVLEMLGCLELVVKPLKDQMRYLRVSVSRCQHSFSDLRRKTADDLP